MKRSLIAFSAILSLSLGLVGCLKDKKFDNYEYGIKDPAASPNGVMLQEGGTKLAIRAVDLATTSQTVRMFEVNYAAESAAPTDIHVNLVNDTALLRAYNTTNGTNLVSIPTNLYTVTSKVTIKAGKTIDTFKLTIPNASLLNPNSTYGFAFRISSVDEAGVTIAENLRTIYIQLSLKNRFDGIYSVVSGSVQRYTAPGSPTVGDALNGSLTGNPDVYLITAGPNSVGIPPSGSTGSLYWAYGNNSQVAGIDNVRIAVDPTTNLVTTSSLGNTTLANWGTMVNKYDPATRTFTLNFAWNPTTNRREYSVILKYKGPR